MAEKKEGREREGGRGGKEKNTERMRRLVEGGRRKRGRVKKKMTDRKFRSAPNAQGSIL